MEGKLGWMAAGLPTEGTGAQQPRAGSLARADVPTCGLTERVGEVRRRAHESGWDSVVVTNDERVVLGMLRDRQLEGDDDRSAEEAMRPGPSTFRPYASLHEMAHFMVEHDLPDAPITTSDGRLIGLLLQAEVLASLRSVVS